MSVLPLRLHCTLPRDLLLYLSSLQNHKKPGKNWSQNSGDTTDGPDRTEVGSEWRDTEFDLKSSKNAGTKIGKLWPTATFINYNVTPTDGIDETDIQQGDELGDCWFLASLASLADGNRHGKPNKARLHALEHVIQMDYNTRPKAMEDGRFMFQFYRLGKWQTVEVDNILPLTRRARRTDDNEWWVCLVEKAYAKFNGSYESIEGGFTGWALTELTGGIAIEMDKLTTRTGFIFNCYLLKCIKNQPIDTTS